jgi:hypothetical protein
MWGLAYGGCVVGDCADDSQKYCEFNLRYIFPNYIGLLLIRKC